jgi:hypothetical protein
MHRSLRGRWRCPGCAPLDRSGRSRRGLSAHGYDPVPGLRTITFLNELGLPSGRKGVRPEGSAEE